MKIGDKVRFLSDTGGGRISGFKGKNIVLVEDEDGFEIPTLISEVVVVDTDDYNISKVHTSAVPNFTNKVVEEEKREQVRTDDDEIISFKMPVEERKGGDALAAYLAFVLMDIKNISNSAFETYFVNDCNYYMRFNYLVAENNSWKLHFTAEAEPNTKLFVEEFTKDVINDMERVAIQIIAYKRNKGFIFKPSVDVKLRIDPVKFYKLHSFQENDFFETPALLYAIVENDEPVKPLVMDAKKMKQSMYGGEKTNKDDNARSNSYVRRYSDDQSKGKSHVRKHNPDVVVVDLHASEVLDSTAGLSNADILNYQLDVFHRTIDEYKNKKGQKIVFIHGKGEGVLRQAILQQLKYRYKSYTYQDASFQEYGYGATQITIR